MPGTDTYLGLRAFVDELVRCGLRDACTSPGSRSTPLVLSFARESRLRATSHLDERCAAFFALGLAKATGIPAVLACTSGTAAANYAPAVIEAHEARVPLLVLTADRPPELRDVGAGQTIDQVKLYGSAAKWYFEIDDHPASAARVRWLRQLACRAFYTAIDGRPGPVHLNFALREPLLPDGDGVPDVEIVPGRDGGRPWVTRPQTLRLASDRLIEGLQEELRTRARMIVVAGRAERDPRLAPAVAPFAEPAGPPLPAQPTPRPRRRLRRARGRAAAGRADLRRAPRARGDRPLRRAAARSGVGHGARARPRAPDRRSPHVQAAAPVAREPRRAAGGLRSRERVAGPVRRRGDDRRRRSAHDAGDAHRQAATQAQGHLVAGRLARGGPVRVAGDRLGGRSGRAQR